MIAANRLPLLVLLASIATLGAAFAFQYIGGLQPCILCWYQRYPHAVAIVLLLAALMVGSASPVGRALVALSGIALVVGAGIGVFHVGVEQHWWVGTASCGTTASPAGSVAELRERLLATSVVRCDEAQWTLLGISMAGYNALISLGLTALCFIAARRESGSARTA